MRLLADRLEALRPRNLYRTPPVVSALSGSRITVQGRSFINFTSNNYLGLAGHPDVVAKAAEALAKWGSGSGASRLLSGNLEVHAQLEERLASFKKEESALIFSSGYLANLGALTALLDEKDVVLMDRLNHASLFDAARLSRAKKWIYPHRDLGRLAELLGRARRFRKRMVITDAYFSMEGDIAPLGDLVSVCRRHDAMLLVDEAHSTGVFGQGGRGLTEHFGVEGKVDVVMGTLSKSLGSVGGYLAGNRLLRESFIQFARTFMYTTATSPAASAAALEAIEVIEREPARRTRLWEHCAFLRERLKEGGWNLLDSCGPIIPILIGDTKCTLEAKAMLEEDGIFAAAIRPPTVPKGTDRIRLSVTAEHTPDELDALVRSLARVRERIL